jgi:hypothetical protein
MLEDLRRPVIAADQDIGERLVVAELDVEARAELLDQIGFEQQRLGFGRGRDDLDIHGRCDHAQDARGQGRIDAGIGRQPLADILGLADVKHVASRIEHAVDAGRGRGQADRVLDRGMSDRKWSLGDRLRGLLRIIRQPRLVVILGDRSRGIDIAGGRLRRHICRRTVRRLPRTRGSRLFSGIVNHGSNLSADAADLKFLDALADRSGKSRRRCHLPLSLRSSLP